MRAAAFSVFTAVLTGTLAAGCGQTEELALIRAENATELGRHDWARLYYAEARAAGTTGPDLERLEATSWLLGYQRSLSEGVSRLEAYLASQPDDSETALLLASNLHILGRLDMSNPVLELLDESARADRWRAEALLDQQPERALGIAIEAASKIEPHGWEGVIRARLLLLAAQAAERLDDASSALRHAEASLVEDPLAQESHYLASRLARRLDLEERAATALEEFEAAGILRPSGTSGPPSLDDQQRAFATLDHPPFSAAPVFQLRALELALDSGDLAAATSRLSQLRAVVGEAPEQWLRLAAAFDEAGSPSVARDLLELALEQRPGDLQTIVGLVRLDLDEGAFDLAAKRLEPAIGSHPRSARLRRQAARLAMGRDDADTALDQLQTAVDWAPWEEGWRRDLATMLRSRGRYEEAAEIESAAPRLEDHPAP